MLVLTRKLGESIAIDDDIKIVVVQIKGRQVRLGIEAPRHTKIHREEVYVAIQEQNKSAAESQPEEVKKAALDLLKKGGVGVLDNMLWSGKVIDPSDKESIALRETAELIRNDDKLSPLLLPVRDGVMVYQKMK